MFCFGGPVFSWAPLLSLNSGWVPFRCAPDPKPPYSTAPSCTPHNGEHKQNLKFPFQVFSLPSAQYGHVICKGSCVGEKKKKKRQNKGVVHYSVEKQSVRACACVFASLHALQANKQDTRKHKPTGKPAIKVKLCGKDMTDVYSLAPS